MRSRSEGFRLRRANLAWIGLLIDLPARYCYGVEEGPGQSQGRTCAWCSAVAGPDDTHCGACGAALAQRESIGDLVIPGVTTVDPDLRAFDAEPLHIPGPSRTQGVASGLLPAAAMGGPMGLAALGGIAAVAAGEYLAAGRGSGTGGPADMDSVGRPSGAVLMAVERLEREGEDALRSPEPAPAPGVEAPGGPADRGAAPSSGDEWGHR